MKAHLHGLAGGLAAHEDQGALGPCQDLCGATNGLAPRCRAKVAVLFDLRLADSMGADDLLELGIAHLAGVLGFNLAFAKLHLDVVAGGPADRTDYILEGHDHLRM